jgi:hypothetical protein
VHEFYAAHISSRTLEALASPNKPYDDNNAVHRFAIDFCLCTEYLNPLHRILEPWAARAQRDYFLRPPGDTAIVVALNAAKAVPFTAASTTTSLTT